MSKDFLNEIMSLGKEFKAEKQLENSQHIFKICKNLLKISNKIDPSIQKEIDDEL